MFETSELVSKVGIQFGRPFLHALQSLVLLLPVWDMSCHAALQYG